MKSKYLIVMGLGAILSLPLVSAEIFSTAQDSAILTFSVIAILAAWAFSQLKK